MRQGRVAFIPFQERRGSVILLSSQEAEALEEIVLSKSVV
jgi:hypothetical protein